MSDGKPMSYQQALGTKYGQQFTSMEPSAYMEFMGKQSKKDIKLMYDPLGIGF
jgi:hypothetical protein